MHPHKRFLFIVLLLNSLTSPAQPVTFISQPDLIHPVSGYVPYSDCAVDMNGDQLDDVVRVGNKGLYIDYQQFDGSFTQRFFSFPIQALPDWSICAGDLDNNGYNDLLFGNGNSASFVKANESGSMYSEAVMPGYLLSQRSTLADINNDGWLDGFVCHDLGQSVPYRNDGSGNMSPDTNLIHTANRPGSYSAIWVDYDNDGDIDLYITKCEVGAIPGDPDRTNLLYQNNGDGSFTEKGSEAGLDDNAQSWSTVFEDFDNDADMDAFIVNHDFQNRLFRNNGDGTFTDVINASGINPNDLGAYENSAGDFNNDGFMDIYAQLQNELYLGHGDLTFTGMDAAVVQGAIADLNNDGFLDIYHNSQVWINQPNAYHWIKASLFGITSNRNGIGARIEIYGPWGIQIREVRSGQSYSPMSSLNTHFGLGQNQQVDSLIVRWPSGIVTHVFNLAADSMYLIPEMPCMGEASIALIEGPTSICQGDTAVLAAPPGFSGYLWSDNQTGQVIPVIHPGRYFGILQDNNGCASLTQAIDIQQVNDVPSKIYSPEGNTICQGDTLVLIATEGKNYLWSNGVTDTQILEVTETGEYRVTTDALCFNGQWTSNPFHVEVLSADVPIVEDVVIVPGDSVLLTADGVNCHWYDQPVGGTLLGTGSNLQTNPITGTTTYYVESHHFYPGGIQSGGKQDTAGQGGIPTQGGFMLFESWEPFTLHAVTVYVPSEGPLGPRFVQLWSGDSLLATKRFEVEPGTNILVLDFFVPIGSFSLQCQQGHLWRNAGELAYPYALGNVGQINTSSFGDGYYYYFYDWQIQRQDAECISARAAVNILISGIHENYGDKEIIVYPIPSANTIYVKLPDLLETAQAFRVVDSYGRVMIRQDIPGQNTFEINLSHLPPAGYVLQVIGDGFLATQKIIKTN